MNSEGKKRPILSLVGLMQVGCLGVALCTLAPHLARLHWALDLLSSFRFQYLLLSSVFFLLFVLARHRVYACLALTCAAINAVFVWPVLFFDAGQTTHATQRLKLFHANVYSANDQYPELIRQVLKENPDVLVLQEVNARWINALKPLKTHYPHHIELPRNDNFGMAIYSHRPFISQGIDDGSDFDVPSIEFEIDVAGQVVRIITAHPPPPVNRFYLDIGQSQFARIAAAVQDSDVPNIVIGDLNTTVWSAEYPILTTGTGLVNASSGHGYIPTWPTHLLPLMIPIDHCLMSKEFTVLDIRTGETFGSDHWPLIVELGF